MCDLCLRVDGGHFRGCPYEPEDFDKGAWEAGKIDWAYDHRRDDHD